MKHSGFATILIVGLLAWGCAVQSTPSPASPSESPAAASRDAQSSALVQRSPRPSRSPVSQAPSRAPVDLGCADITAARPVLRPAASLPPAPRPSIRGGNDRVAADVADAAKRLAGLSSYQFAVDIVGANPGSLEPDSADFSFRGKLSRTNGLAIDAVAGMRMRELDNSAAISVGSQVLFGGGYVWTSDNTSGVLEPSPADAGAAISVLTPEGVAARAVVPFGAGYLRVGAERHGGIQTVRYRASDRGAAAYAAAFGTTARVTADLWIAAAGGYLAAVHIAAPGALVQFEVTHPDDPANVVVLPVPPLPDPAGSSGPPVDLQVEYQVRSADGADPTDAELGDIAHDLRVRLDIGTRPVRVDVERRYRILVTVCHTTDPDGDRRLLLARGALTVVPLPRSEYGTTTAPGPTALPAAGDPIDPALQPLAPASGLGITGAHVDPTTGRRGVAFRLSNQASAVFRAYATGHLGEFVAVVLDGTILAVLPIEGSTADGNFAFTGDYTEADTHRLARMLYLDPMEASLTEISHVEIPAGS